MIPLQAITQQGSISADWTLVVAFGVIGFLLVAFATVVGRHFINSLDAIKSEVKNLRTDVTDLQKENIKHDAELAYLRQDKNETLEKIFNTLESLKG